jgi:alkylation response protein AidB-like acyl-CoA dehydrogenase
MRLNLTEEQELVRDTARRFLENKAPISVIRALYETDEGFSHDLWIQASQLGWNLLALPESAGGLSASGATGQDLGVVAEEMGRLIGAGPFLPTAVSLLALAEGQSSDAAQALTPGIASGETIVAWAFGEPGNVWESADFETRATIDVEGVLLEGVKAYVEAGAQADVLLVTARAGDDIVQVVTPSAAPGVIINPGRSVDFVKRFAEVRLEGVRAPRSAVIAAGPQAGALVERQLQLALLLQCAETNGALERAFEFTVDYMRDRFAFGRSIASFQALKHRLADMLLRIHSCMATTDAALEAFDARSPEAGKLARVAKAYVGSKSVAIVGDLVQMTGGIAVTWDHDLHLYERRIALNRALLGTPEHYRSQVHSLISR